MGEELFLFLVVPAHHRPEEAGSERHGLPGRCAPDGWRGLSRTWIHYFPSFFGHRVAQGCYKLSKCVRDIPGLPRTVLPQRSVPATPSGFIEVCFLFNISPD